MEIKVALSLKRINFVQLAQILKTKANALLKADASANNQALGFALGTFISLLPTPGFNFALALLLATVVSSMLAGPQSSAIRVVARRPWSMRS